MTSITIASNWVSLIVTLLIPVAVAAITKAHLQAKYKSALTVIFAGLVVLIHRSQVDGGAAIISTQVAFDWVVTTAVSVATYLGFWKPLDVNGNVAPEKGIGPK